MYMVFACMITCLHPGLSNVFMLVDINTFHLEIIIVPGCAIVFVACNQQLNYINNCLQ